MMGQHQSSNAIAASGERLPHLDAIRALALFGVILMNIGSMVMRFAGESAMAKAGALDLPLMLFDLVFVQGKARAAFAFLFGLGFAILMMRADIQGADFKRLYTRRMLALLAFGVVNQIFLYWGDILVLYALLGLALLPARNWSDARVLGVGLALILIPPLMIGVAGALSGGALPSLIVVDAAREAARGLAAVTSPAYFDFVAFSATQAIERRLTDTAHMIIYDLGVFGLFLIGMWTARRGLLFDVAAHRAELRRIALLCLPLGLLLSLVYAARFADAIPEGPLNALAETAYIGLPVLAFGYIAILALIFRRGARRLQALLAPVGRMPLTNYLASGAIGCILFYGYGFALIDNVGFADMTLIASALFAGLTLFSHLWLARFRQGPAEWLWRRMIYGSPSRRLSPA